jgi:hypothetical protein
VTEDEQEKPALENFEDLLGGLLSVPKKALDKAIESLKPDRETCEPEAEEDATE